MLAAIAAITTATTIVLPAHIAAAQQQTGQDNALQAPNKPKPPKCDNVQIQAKVKGYPEGTTEVRGTAILSSGASVSRVSGVDANETQTALIFSFKKQIPCPAQGDTANIEISGDTFSAVQATVAIKDVKKPNKITIDVGQAPAPVSVQAQAEQ